MPRAPACLQLCARLSQWSGWSKLPHHKHIWGKERGFAFLYKFPSSHMDRIARIWKAVFGQMALMTQFSGAERLETQVMMGKARQGQWWVSTHFQYQLPMGGTLATIMMDTSHSANVSNEQQGLLWMWVQSRDVNCQGYDRYIRVKNIVRLG